MVHVENALLRAREALTAGRLEEAERETRSVLEFDGAEPRALRILGEVARSRGRDEVAAELFEKAGQARDPESRSTPEGPVPTPTLAELLSDQGHFEAAANVYRDLLEGSGGDPRADEWRRRLVELEGAAGPEESGGAGPGDKGMPPPETEEASRRLRAFVDRIEASAQVRRLQAFLSHLDSGARP